MLMRPSWTRNRSQIQSCLSVTITALPKSSSAGIVFVASRACSAQPRNISFAERLVGLIKPLQKKIRMMTVISEKKLTSQSDKMMRWPFFYTCPALQSWKAVFPLWCTTTQHLGRACEWHLWSSQVWKWCIVCTSQSYSRIFFFLEIADVAREHQTHDQPTESGKLFVGQHVSPSLGVSTLASSEREQVPREQM